MNYYRSSGASVLCPEIFFNEDIAILAEREHATEDETYRLCKQFWPHNPAIARKNAFYCRVLPKIIKEFFAEQVPSVAVVWNFFPPFNVVRDILAELQIPTFTTDKGLLGKTLFVDRQGMNGSSWLADPTAWNSILTEIKDTLDLERASQYIADYQVDLRSGWEQPDYESPAQLRARLGIPSHQQIIFIPSQVLADSNMLLHHGRFHNNSSFIKALTTQLLGRTDIFFLVKQHPKEPDIQKDIPAVLKDRGVWIKDVNTFTAIEASCAVMTLNSTVGLEAVLRGKPVVVFAPSLYSHKGFTYEVANDDALNALLDLFLSGWSQSQTQKLQLLYFIAYLLQYYLIPAEGNSNTCAFNKVLNNLESIDNQLGTSEFLHTKIADFEQRYCVENRKRGSTKKWKERINSFFHRKA
jgi:hypothetical protein